MRALPGLVAGLLLGSSCLGQQAIPDPAITDSERAWLEERLGVDLHVALLDKKNELDLPSPWRGYSDYTAEHRLATLWIRALRQALWSDDAELRHAAARQFTLASDIDDLLPRDVRRIVRTLAPSSLLGTNGISCACFNELLDGDTLGELLRQIPPAPAASTVDYEVSQLHRSLHRRHLPELARIARAASAANEKTLHRVVVGLAHNVAARSDVDAMRSFARDLAQIEGEDLSTRGAEKGLSDTLRFAIDRALLQPSELIVERSRSWLLNMLRAERAGPRDLDLARRLLGFTGDGDGHNRKLQLAREVAMRILADIGHRPLLGEHRADDALDVRMLALAGLATLGDVEAVQRLQHECVDNPHAALALAEADPQRLGRRFGEQAAQAESYEDLPCDSWQDWLPWTSFRVPDDLGDHLVAGYFAAGCGADALLGLAATSASCRTEQLVEAAFRDLEAREPGGWMTDGPQLDLLELADEGRLRRLARRWLLDDDLDVRSEACTVLLQIGDPASATQLITALKAGHFYGEFLRGPYADYPVALLARSDSLAVREFVTEELRKTRHAADAGAFEDPWGIWLTAALLGGLTEAAAQRMLPEYVDSYEPHEEIRSSRWFQHLEQFRGVDAFVARIEDEPTYVGPTFSAALVEDHRVGTAFRARYDQGHATAADLVRADPILARRLIDDALAAGWYAAFESFYNSVPNEIWCEGNRITRLLDLTESNCCLGTNTTSILRKLMPLNLKNAWGDRALPFQRETIRRYLPRLRYSRLTGRLAVAPR